ncbi:interferon regulatory factor 9 [Mixophyes fleayi]|uniref:interferon regulatory factor 9 n=1 Tax=Mixophyes fleayi TaxID=3061075 RepID=UPI003F4E03B9
MASRRVRPTRKLKPWLVEQIESAKFTGLMWDDEQKTSFRIPWKHAGKQDFRHDEDAAIFKAWAVYKNKYQTGEKKDAATWKTRLRCALNKSPEFQEVPERSQLDIFEPYKVYRIVPPEEQAIAPSERAGRKRKSTADSRSSSSDEVDQVKKEPQIFTLELSRVETSEVSSNSPEDSGVGSDTSNTDIPNFQPKTEYESCSPNTHIATLTPPTVPSHITHTDLQVTVIYSGIEVSQCLVRSGECKLSARVPPAHLVSGMEHVLLPIPDDRLAEDTRTKTSDLLKFLQAGVMLASTSNGIFAQRQKSCSGRIFWTGPCVDNEGEINKLERDAYVQLFDAKKFLRELEIYRTEGGMPPNYHVTLCFGEEISDCDSATDKLITARIEQVVASESVRQATENHLAAQSKSQLLQDPPAPFLIPLLPVDMSASSADLCSYITH